MLILTNVENGDNKGVVWMSYCPFFIRFPFGVKGVASVALWM